MAINQLESRPPPVSISPSQWPQNMPWTPRSCLSQRKMDGMWPWAKKTIRNGGVSSKTDGIVIMSPKKQMDQMVYDSIIIQYYLWRFLMINGVTRQEIGDFIGICWMITPEQTFTETYGNPVVSLLQSIFHTIWLVYWSVHLQKIALC